MKIRLLLAFNNIEILRESSFTPIINEQEIAYGLIILKKLDLDHNQISVIEVETFKYLPSLAYLNLGSNNIRELNDYTFNGFFQISLNSHATNKQTTNKLYSLQNLDLSNNKIEMIKVNNLPSLTNLNLSNNSLRKITDQTFLGLKNLRKLFLDQNLIEILNENSFSNLPLSKINLIGNLIKVISKNSFDLLTDLGSLDLSNQLIEELPLYVLSNMPVLELLNLRNNNIYKLNGFSFFRLIKLSELNLQSNSINIIEINRAK